MLLFGPIFFLIVHRKHDFRKLFLYKKEKTEIRLVGWKFLGLFVFYRIINGT